jgi:hypothetical protein
VTKGQVPLLLPSATARAYASWFSGPSRWLTTNKTRPGPSGGGVEAKAEGLPLWRLELGSKDVAPLVKLGSWLRLAGKLVLTTVGHGSLLYATQLLLPVGLSSIVRSSPPVIE